MDSWPEVVITGLGVVSPIGIGCQAFWESLCAGRSGVSRIDVLQSQPWGSSIGGIVRDFDSKNRVRPRKALKVMSREIQMAFVAADMAVEASGIVASGVDPERFGIVFGADLIPCELEEIAGAIRSCMVDGHFDFSLWGKHALSELYPLWLLKYLPNMPACHIGIAHDARGPSNSLTLAEVSGLASLVEAVRVIQRGEADVMIAGGTGCRTNPSIWVREGAYNLSRRYSEPASACRPFDALRDGMVHGEGAGAVVLERRDHAEARGAKIMARVLGFACTFEPRRLHQPVHGTAIRQAIRLSLKMAGLRPSEIGHVNAHGVSTVDDDIAEATAIRQELGDVPVTATKSFFGNLAAGTGIVEMAASVLGFIEGKIPFTLNYEVPDPRCPIDVVANQPRPLNIPTAVVLNHSRIGQAVSVVLASG
ncbi:MAG: beta-ketoacyl-[acyl-carrier-protein] synthase family protein [Thermogutta sp.]